jgi:hypothetical protein
MKDEDAQIPDYEKKRMENIAEKKATFDEKLAREKKNISRFVKSFRKSGLLLS